RHYGRGRSLRGGRRRPGRPGGARPGHRAGPHPAERRRLPRRGALRGRAEPVLRYDDIEARLDGPPPPIVVSDAFPTDRDHGWKFIAFGPDGMLYVPVGAPCNVCEPPGPRHETITRMRPDGSGLEAFARGVRNSVGFDWDPRTRGLWFTDNGRAWLGDDRPPDELNYAPRPGLHFGFPYCHGRSIPD